MDTEQERRDQLAQEAQVGQGHREQLHQQQGAQDTAAADSTAQAAGAETARQERDVADAAPASTERAGDAAAPADVAQPQDVQQPGEPAGEPGGPIQPPAQPVGQAPPDDRESLPEDWPTRGYSGPQPWEASNPPELTHDKGLLTSGEAGDDVVELCQLLANLGIETSTSRGENPHGIFDDSVRAGVEAFRAQYGVKEDPQVVAATIAAVVGPWTWEALSRAAAKARAEAERD